MANKPQKGKLTIEFHAEKLEALDLANQKYHDAEYVVSTESIVDMTLSSVSDRESTRDCLFTRDIITALYYHKILDRNMRNMTDRS